MNKQLQTVYIPVNGDIDLAVCYFSGFEEWTHKENVTQVKAYVFTPEELKQLLEDYTDRIVKNAQFGTVEDSDEYIKCQESITSQLSLILKELGI